MEPKYLIRTILTILLGIIIVGSCAFAQPYVFGYFNGTRPIPGDPTHFDPFASYQQAIDLVGGDVQIVSIDMQYVKSDGTLDMTADYGPKVHYDLVRIISSSTPTGPLGVSKQASVLMHLVSITVSKPAIVKGGTYNFGIDPYVFSTTSKLTDTIADLPHCALKQLWEVAKTMDAPDSSVATIHFDSNGYRFKIEGTNIDLRFGIDCKLM